MLLNLCRTACVLAVLSFAGCDAEEEKVAVVVAAADLPSGKVLTFDDVSQRLASASEVSSAQVVPSSVTTALNHPLTAPVRAGEPLRWSHFGLQPPDSGR